VPELPDPTDILRGLEMIRSALVAPGNVGDALPRAVDRATEVTGAINRLTDELAKLNAHVERALPLLESFDQHAKRAVPVIESIQQAETGFLSLRRTIRRAARENDARAAREPDARAAREPEPVADSAKAASTKGERPSQIRRAKAKGGGPGDRR
jgi:hypothetical protein